MKKSVTKLEKSSFLDTPSISTIIIQIRVRKWLLSLWYLIQLFFFSLFDLNDFYGLFLLQCNFGLKSRFVTFYSNCFFDLIFSNRFLCARHWPICMKGLKRRIGVWSTRGFLCCSMIAGRPGLEPLRKSHSFWPREELALLCGRTRLTTSRTTKLLAPLSTPCACRVVSIPPKNPKIQ